jgi:dipeptidase E
MGLIVAIGGGEIRLGETLAIDRAIVALAHKERPLALFLPTASGESQGYIDTFHEVYGEKLGCQAEALLLLSGDATQEEIRQKILSADIIYVGGGNTKKMMEVWREKRVDEYLREAYQRATILSGLSAGSICWFSQGFSDSEKEDTRSYCVVNGLGLIDAIACPHYNERGEFDDFMKSQTKPGIAIENNCAVVFRDGTFRIIKSDDSSHAYLLRSTPAGMEKILLNNPEERPLSSLLVKAEVRYVQPEDIPGMARVYVDTWKAAYPGMIPQEYLDSLNYASWEERYRTRYAQMEGNHYAVLVKDSQVIGVSSFMKNRDDDLPESCGEIVSIYVLKEHWSRGHGKRLMRFATGELKKLGFTDCCLWTLEQNSRAQRAYERFGFHRDGTRRAIEISGENVWEIRYQMSLADDKC